ncbi:tumor necrosis factor receptor superfamily member 9 [Varanus komodoensis]|uniref:tumor necrosis factor receptor superfamily member 9 n=1 Tax=Varanus komodoensis TaxID=61221 RepID=UPI001CF7C714|nr:tumor necrosis factor receptor superfamily member 9 [Varanus komodoensis]
MGCRAAPLLPLVLLLPGALGRARAEGRPCQPGTYREAPTASHCAPCRVCDGHQREYVRNCSEFADAICKCVPEYSCGEAAEECGKCPCAPWQKQTRKGCQSCSEGMLNNLAAEEEDVNCKPEWKGPTQPPTNVAEIDNHLIPISITLIMVLLLCVLTLLLSCVFIRFGAQAKHLKLPHEQLAQEVDDCSYRYPEEEEGEHSKAIRGLKGELLENIP